ncbi:MAG: right-handed parallel beta-helix repeat-containing protein [Phycisphaerae bacterium]
MRKFERMTCCLASVLFTLSAGAADWIVDDNAPADVAAGGAFNPLISDPLEAGTPGHPFDCIQEAINAAVSGDRVIVRPGIYNGPAGSNYNTNLSFHGKSITVSGPAVAATVLPFDPTAATIDCGGTDRAFIFNTGETNAARVLGFRIVNGANAAGGGAAYCDHASPTFAGCRFDTNTTTSRGGAAYLVLSAPQFSDCLFVGNSATSFGGAVYALTSNAVFTACRFESNTADAGGAIHMLSNADCVLTDTNLVSNHAASGGGALFIDNGSDPRLTTCTISGNTSSDSGGGLYLDRSSSVFLDECTLNSNTAEADGGAAYVTESGLTFNNSTATANTAHIDGGAIAAVLGSELQLLGGIIGQGLAIGDGGGVYSDDSTITVIGVSFNTNTANNRGGGMALTGGSLTADSLNFNDNVSPVGAGLANNAGTIVYRTGTIRGNTATTRGGGMLTLGSTSVYLGGVNFLLNQVTAPAGRGGGLSCGLSVVTLDNCGFDTNSAAFGGGIHNFDSDVTALWTAIVRNTSTNAGGGIVNVQSRAALVRTDFYLNTTGGTGGAVHSEQQNGPADMVFMQNCHLDENAAFTAGAALYFAQNSVAEISNCRFSRNAIAVGGGTGGAIRAETSLLRVINDSFSRNHAETTGGGVSADLGAVVDIDNSILWGNDDAGGATFTAQVWLTPASGSTVTMDHSCVMNLPAVLPPGAGIGLISFDPLFTDPAADDLTLKPGSPCIDAGNNAAVLTDQFDLDEDLNMAEKLPLDAANATRFLDDPGVGDCAYSPGTCGAAPIVDMGAYEFASVSCAGDADHDGDVDSSDLGIVLANWHTTVVARTNGDLDGSGYVDESDLGILLGSWGCVTP